MDPKQDFGDFLAEFTYLAEEAKQPESMRKADLYRKLPTLLQNQVMADAGEDSVTLDRFVKKYQITARLISQQFANRAENRAKGTGQSTKGATTKKDSTTGKSDRKPSSANQLTDKEKATLLKEGRCFICREQGHVSRDCPTKNQATNAAATSHQENNSKGNKKQELEEAEASGSDSGKE